MTRASDQVRPPPAWHEEFQHEALLYSGDAEYLAATVPFVTEGVAAGEPVMVAVPGPRLSALRVALGDVGHHVAFDDMGRIGANPAHIIPVWRDFLDRHGRGTQPVRGIGEPIWAGRGPDELVECHRHEALLNVAFAGSGSWRLLCPYDTTTLDPSVIEEARRSHPIVTQAGTRATSDECRDLDAMGRPFDAPLPPPPATADSVGFVALTLPSVRRFVVRLAAVAGLRPPRLDDLTLSVHEMAANSVRHGGGSGVVRGWADDERVVFEVADRGRVVDPLAGRTKPALGGVHGRGLWMAHQLCDLVQLRTFEAGTVVRLHMHVNRRTA